MDEFQFVLYLKLITHRLSHGFLLPKVVATLPTHSSPSPPFDLPQKSGYRPSTVVPEGPTYFPPFTNLEELTHEQRIEALVEESPLSFLNKHNVPDDIYANQEEMEEFVRQAWRQRWSIEDRFRDRGRGSTVLVHQVKEDEWWLETAEALLGPPV